jgi:hypothetical protein
MKLSTSKRQEAQVKRELLKSRCLELKLAKESNEAIAAQLFREGLGVERDGKLEKPYAPGYVAKIIRTSLSEIAAERSGYGQELQVILDHDLETLINYWMPIALGEAVDNDGNPLPPSLKAADLVRKLTADRALLTGANEAKRLELAVKYESDVENFVNVLRELLDEETFSKILTAIDQATQLNSEYWSQNQKQLEGNSDILEADIVEG